jgi:SRSO17 transposase
MAVASWAGSLLAWQRELVDLKALVAQVFGRRELKETSGVFLNGLLSGIGRKTGWMMAEQAGAARPYRMQSLLGRSRWEADDLGDQVRDYVIAALGDADGVLVVDETGFLKKGAHSVGVARQYSGTAGRIENCQVGVFLGYASRFGHALIDRRLYLPQVWADDAARRAKATVPQATRFMTKPEIARELIATALDAEIPCAFVLADALYGADRRLRRMLEAREQPYVLAVRSNEPMRSGGNALELTTSGELAASLPANAWACHAAGEGAKGPRLYDWARRRLLWSQDARWEHWLLVRRSRNDPDALAYYVVFAPAATTLAELAAVAGLRWTIETCFETAKDELGLDHCEARSWHGWHRHVTLVMAALAFLAKLRADLLRASMIDAAERKRNERSPRAGTDSPTARRSSASRFRQSVICSPAPCS